jgi:PAS domain S-box-containing protein
VSEQVRAFGFHERELLGKRRVDAATDAAAEPQKWREHMATLERHEPFRDFVYQRRRPDGTLRIVSASGKPVFDGDGRFTGYRGVARDITELRRAEEMLRDREQRIRDAQLELARVTRVTTLGELTASIAHEINQPLAAIVADANASLNWLAPPDPDVARVRDSLDAIIKDGHRAGEVIQRIRQLTTKGETQKGTVDVNGVIRDVMPLLRSELQRHRVAAQADLAEALPSVLADPVQLQQVIINLLMNAVEAMATVEDRPRQLVIRSRVGADEVTVTVRDAGVGIDPARSTSYSARSSAPSPAAWAWDFRSAAPSSRRTAGGSGPRRTRTTAPRFTSRCRRCAELLTPSALRAHGRSRAS